MAAPTPTTWTTPAAITPATSTGKATCRWAITTRSATPTARGTPPTRAGAAARPASRRAEAPGTCTVLPPEIDPGQASLVAVTSQAEFPIGGKRDVRLTHFPFKVGFAGPLRNRAGRRRVLRRRPRPRRGYDRRRAADWRAPEGGPDTAPSRRRDHRRRRELTLRVHFHFVVRSVK